MGARLTTFQNLLETQLRTMQSAIVHLIHIEEILGDIRDGRVLALPETRNIRRRLATVNEELVIADEDTIMGSSDNSNSDDYLEEAIV